MYWKWKSMIIDFSKLSKEKIEYDYWTTKVDWVLYYLGIPDDKEHHWENGEYSSEYDKALEYAQQLDLVEKIDD